MFRQTTSRTMGVLALLACVLVLLLAGNLVAPSNASQPLSLVSSPKHTTHVFRATPGLGGGATSGGESVVWENPEISKIAIDDATGAMLTADGRLYMWGTLRMEHEPTTWRNVPVEAYLPSGETPPWTCSSPVKMPYCSARVASCSSPIASTRAKAHSLHPSAVAWSDPWALTPV